MMGITTIQLDDETKRALYERKEMGDSYDDVVRELLQIAEREEREVAEA